MLIWLLNVAVTRRLLRADGPFGAAAEACQPLFGLLPPPPGGHRPAGGRGVGVEFGEFFAAPLLLGRGGFLSPHPRRPPRRGGPCLGGAAAPAVVERKASVGGVGGR